MEIELVLCRQHRRCRRRLRRRRRHHHFTTTNAYATSVMPFKRHTNYTCIQSLSLLNSCERFNNNCLFNHLLYRMDICQTNIQQQNSIISLSSPNLN